MSSSALSFIINQPPTNGSCSVTPLNGTTSTSFTITCSHWQDPDGIKDYSIYSESSSSSFESDVHAYLSQARLLIGQIKH
jgi:hypothetical protein